MYCAPSTDIIISYLVCIIGACRWDADSATAREGYELVLYDAIDVVALLVLTAKGRPATCNVQQLSYVARNHLTTTTKNIDTHSSAHTTADATFVSVSECRVIAHTIFAATRSATEPKDKTISRAPSGRKASGRGHGTPSSSFAMGVHFPETTFMCT